MKWHNSHHKSRITRHLRLVERHRDTGTRQPFMVVVREVAIRQFPVGFVVSGIRQRVETYEQTAT